MISFRYGRKTNGHFSRYMKNHYFNSQFIVELRFTFYWTKYDCHRIWLRVSHRRRFDRCSTFNWMMKINYEYTDKISKVVWLFESNITYLKYGATRFFHLLLPSLSVLHLISPTYCCCCQMKAKAKSKSGWMRLRHSHYKSITFVQFIFLKGRMKMPDQKEQ